MDVELRDTHWPSSLAALLGHLDGAVEGGLDGGGCYLTGGDVCGPGEDRARERLGNHKAVPGAELPGALGLVVEAANPGPGGLGVGGLAIGSLLTDGVGEPGGTGFGDVDRAARPVGGDGAAAALGVGELQIAQPGSSAARAGAANREEAEQRQGARAQFAIEARAHE